jgi:formylglycine-generating enzyme
VTGGPFRRTEDASKQANVADFCLDRYEVTVGRFRRFLGAYSLGWRPIAGDGAHPLIGPQSGWDSSWTNNLPATVTAFADAQHLGCSAASATWRDSPGSGAFDPETYPINCVSWYEAFAFCIWDGGRLPTSAEWEYAASGGSQNRDYPWEGTLAEPYPANYLATANTPFLPVGSYPAGDGLFGQSDLAGSLWEWALDYPGTLPSACDNCADLSGTDGRVFRGGDFSNPGNLLRNGNHGSGYSGMHGPIFGLRCARSVSR